MDETIGNGWDMDTIDCTEKVEVNECEFGEWKWIDAFIKCSMSMGILCIFLASMWIRLLGLGLDALLARRSRRDVGGTRDALLRAVDDGGGERGRLVRPGLFRLVVHFGGRAQLALLSEAVLAKLRIYTLLSRARARKRWWTG